MNFLEERILKDGIIKEGNVLKVDSFLNHQMDIDLFNEIGREFKKRFEGKEINKNPEQSKHPESGSHVLRRSIFMCRSYLQKILRASIWKGRCLWQR